LASATKSRLLCSVYATAGIAHLSASAHISQISVRRTAHTLVGPPHDQAVIAMQKGSLKTSAMNTATVAR